MPSSDSRGPGVAADRVRVADPEVEGGSDETLTVGSVFGVWDCGKKLSVFARVDRSFDGNPEAAAIPYLALADDSEFYLAMAGVDCKIDRAVSVIPNVEYVAYLDTDGRPAPDDDLIARLTLSFRF